MGENWRKVQGENLYYFLQLHVNLQCTQNKLNAHTHTHTQKMTSAKKDGPA